MTGVSNSSGVRLPDLHPVRPSVYLDQWAWIRLRGLPTGSRERPPITGCWPRSGMLRRTAMNQLACTPGTTVKPLVPTSSVSEAPRA